MTRRSSISAPLRSERSSTEAIAPRSRRPCQLRHGTSAGGSDRPSRDAGACARKGTARLTPRRSLCAPGGARGSDGSGAGHEAGRGGVAGAREEVLEQVGDAGEPAHVDLGGRSGPRGSAGGEPGGDRARLELARPEHVDEAERAQAAGADDLLVARLRARDDERARARRENLADGAVAAHRDDVVGEPDQRLRVGDEVEDAQVVALGGEGVHGLARGVRHERAGDDDAGASLRQLGARERLGQRVAVLAAAQYADRHAAARQAQLAAAGGEVSRGGALRGAAVEVAGEADHPADVLGQVVLRGEVVDPRVAVDPDRVVAAAQDVERTRALELRLHAVRVVEDLAQAEHETGAHRAQDAEALAQFVVDAERHPVDDQHLGVERGERVAQGPGADPDGAGLVEADVGPAARAVEVGARRREGERLGALRQLEEGGLARSGDEPDRRRPGRGERMGDRDAAAHVAEPVLVVGIEGDSAHAKGYLF